MDSKADKNEPEAGKKEKEKLPNMPNSPEKLSRTEEEILKKYLGSHTIDKNLEEEIDKLKEEIEKVHRTISPDTNNPLKDEINDYIKANRNDVTNN